MARMHPAVTQDSIFKSVAERKVYELLSKLDDSYHVIYGAEFYGKITNGRLVKGECDFLIVHPDHGVLVLEVKGGRIAPDAHSTAWFTIDRNDMYHRLTPPPWEQVLENRRNLEAILRRAPELQGMRFPMAVALWFPDITWNHGTLAAFPVDLIMDSRHAANPQTAIEAIFAFAIIQRQDATPLPPEAITAFIQRFAPAWGTPDSLPSEIQAGSRTIAALTDAQWERFKRLMEQRRLFLPGLAGTGKTILAFEAARALATMNKHTLFVCVNENQAAWLRERMEAECDVEYFFDIMDLRALAHATAMAAGIAETVTRAAIATNAADQKSMADLMNRCIARAQSLANAPDWRYDAVIVDEAQDIEKPLLRAIERLLRHPTQSHFLIFADPFQRVDFAGGWELPFNTVLRLPALTENLRNTGTIVEVMRHFNPVLGMTEFRGPVGRPVEFVEANLADAAAVLAAVRATVERLIEAEHLVPEQILIISGRTYDKSNWRQWRRDWKVRLNSLTELRQRKTETGRDAIVRFATIRAAKGLESDVVILVELDGVNSQIQRDKLIYIAASRARHHLIVIGGNTDLAPRKKR